MQLYLGRKINQVIGLSRLALDTVMEHPGTYDEVSWSLMFFAFFLSHLRMATCLQVARCSWSISVQHCSPLIPLDLSTFSAFSGLSCFCSLCSFCFFCCVASFLSVCSFCCFCSFASFSPVFVFSSFCSLSFGPFGSCGCADYEDL